MGGYKTVAATAAVILLSVSAVAAQTCLSDRERAAVQVRLLQTELMVATLSCRGGDYTQRYNAFVSKFMPELNEHGKSLKTYFAREHGKAANARLDAFITRVANEFSLRSMNEPDYCDVAGAKLNDARDLRPGELVKFSLTSAAVPVDVSGCRLSEPSVTAKR